MSGFGALGGFGLLSFGPSESAGEAIFRSLLDSVSGAFSIADGEHVEASAYARALALADARATLRRGFDQRRVLYSTELLAAHERTFSIVPEPGDSLDVRRRRVAARQVLAHGSTRDSLLTALGTLLGADFIALYVKPHGTPTTYPPSPAIRGAWDDPAVAGRYFRLTHAVATVGRVIEFAYENLLEDGARMAATDVLSVQPENPRLSEAITIVSASAAGPLTARAQFARAHDTGAIVRTHAPVWISTQRSMIVVVSSAAAAKPNVVRSVNNLMRRLVRGTTTWAVVEATGPSTMGPFLPSAPIGRTTLESISF